jgi:hypothetical protein
MTKQHAPNSCGITPILSNAKGHCNSYGKTLTTGGVTTITGPQPQIGASPTMMQRANRKPMAGSQTSSKGGHR